MEEMPWCSGRSGKRGSRFGLALNPWKDASFSRRYHVANVAQLLAAISTVNNSSSTNTILLSKGRYDLPGELQIQNAGNLTIRPATTNTTVSLVGEVLNRVIDVEGGKVTLGRLSISGRRQCGARRRRLCQ